MEILEYDFSIKLISGKIKSDVFISSLYQCCLPLWLRESKKEIKIKKEINNLWWFVFLFVWILFIE